MSRKPICANCGIEIRWRPTIVDGVAYCCLGCSRGGPCECDYARLPSADDHAAIEPFVIPAHGPSSNRKSEQPKNKG